MPFLSTPFTWQHFLWCLFRNGKLRLGASMIGLKCRIGMGLENLFHRVSASSAVVYLLAGREYNPEGYLQLYSGTRAAKINLHTRDEYLLIPSHRLSWQRGCRARELLLSGLVPTRSSGQFCSMKNVGESITTGHPSSVDCLIDFLNGLWKFTLGRY